MPQADVCRNLGKSPSLPKPSVVRSKAFQTPGDQITEFRPQAT